MDIKFAFRYELLWAAQGISNYYISIRIQHIFIIIQPDQACKAFNGYCNGSEKKEEDTRCRWQFIFRKYPKMKIILNVSNIEFRS